MLTKHGHSNTTRVVLNRSMFIKKTYLRCIWEQLRNALNDKSELGTIYRGLTGCRLAKREGAKNLFRIKHHNCNQSPTTKTIYLIKTTGGTHL